jgi:ECF sigma factor
LAGGISWWLKAMNDVTRILTAIEQGDGQAAEQLLPLVYDELRKLAAARMAAENPGHTLNATALVHEAYLRLVGDQHFDDRGHFFAAAAEAMRRILVNHARDRKRLKRAGGRRRLELLDQIGSVAEDWVRQRILAFVESGPYEPEAPASVCRGECTRWRFGLVWLVRGRRKHPASLPGRAGGVSPLSSRLRTGG